MPSLRVISYSKLVFVIVVSLLWLSICAYYLPRSPTFFQQNEIMPIRSPNAYVFYATQDEYACAVLVNIFLLKTVFQTRHRLIVLLSPEVSEEYRLPLMNLGVTVIEEEPMPLHPSSISLLKLSAFQLHTKIKDIQRVLVLDADQLILRDLDHLFRLPPQNFQAPSAYWIGDSFLSSAMMLIEPSDELWASVYEDFRDIPSGYYDMDIINSVFLGTSPQLPGAYVTLNSHWEDWNLPLWSEIRSKSETSVSNWDLYNLYLQAYIVHFTAVGKPWYYDLASVKERKPYAHDVLFQQWERWRSIALVVCPAGILNHV